MTNPRHPSPRIQAHCRPGSVLILSVVVLVLMAMMGAAYLQMARLDRTTSRLADNRSQDYEGSILRFIGQILANDGPELIYTNDDRREFNDASEDRFQERYDYPWTRQRQGRDREANGDLLTNVPFFSTTLYGGFFSEGDGPRDGDDAWLASIEPDYTTDPAGVWPHISNLRGVFLDLNDIDTATGLPRQYLTTAEDQTAGASIGYSTNVPLFGLGGIQDQFNGLRGDRIAADADGDGIADSRWTWAPLPVTRGRRYVMAVRIVDNSAMANINVWNKMSEDGRYDVQPGNPQSLPRWYWPGDLDLDPSFTEGLAAPATSALGLQALLRLMDENTSGRGYGNPIDWEERVRNWIKAGRLYDNPQNDPSDRDDFNPLGGYLETGERINGLAREDNFVLFNNRSEAELRFKNGLNRTSDFVTADSDSDLEATALITPAVRTNFWRADNAESEFTDAGFASSAAGIQEFFQNEPRKRLTLFSGAGAFGKLYLNKTYDENNPAADSEARANDVADHFADRGIITGGTAYPPATAAMGIWPNFTEFTERLGAVLADFRDEDSVLTDINGNGIYGMEYLPFVSEVYLEERLQTPNTVSPPIPPATDPFTLDFSSPGTDGWAAGIELVNPWPWPIEADDLDVELRVGNDSWGNLGTIFTDAGLEELEGHARILLYRLDSSDPNNNDQFDTAITSYTTNGDGSSRTIDLSADNPDWPTGGGTVEITLRAGTASGAPDAVYQRFDAPQRSGGFSLTFLTNAEATAALGAAGGPGSMVYRQAVAQGTADGLSALTVLSDEVPIRRAAYPSFLPGATASPPLSIKVSPPNELDAIPFSGGNNGGTLDDPDKNVFGDPSPNFPGGRDLDNAVLDSSIDEATASTAGDQKFLIGNTGRIYRAGDIFQLTLLGPTSTQTVAEVWHDAAAAMAQGGAPRAGSVEFHLKDFMINPRDAFNLAGGVFPNYTAPPITGDPVYYGDGDNAVTFGTRFLDIVTTEDPSDDDLDNDNDSRVDDPDENLVPGKINFNTASRDLLARALPFDAPAASYATASANKQNLIDLIVNYRDGSSTDPANPRATSDGIASRGTAINQAGLSLSSRIRPGIAYLGELLPDGNFDNVFADTRNLGSNAVLDSIADFNEYEIGHDDNPDGDEGDPAGAGNGNPPNTGHRQDAFRLDAEELTQALSALNQVGSVRSDVFTAYVVVRAYPDGDFDADPLEEYRLIATFDRSVIHETRPLPKLRHVSIIRQP